MKSLLSITAALLFASVPALAEEPTTIAYPTTDAVEFTVVIPAGWKMIQQGDPGAEEFFEVEGPNGLELSFRSIAGAEIEKAVETHVAYLKENFTDVKPAELKEIKIDGQEAILLPAGAKDEDGKVRDTGAGWFKISDAKIGELWWNVEEGDAAGAKAAIEVLNSIKIPKK